MLRLRYSNNFVLDWGLEIIYFPFWWYSFGLLRVFKFSGKFLKERENRVGFLLWLSNIFVPMYGQYDLAGRFTSFIVRFVQVIFRGIFMSFFALISFLFVLIWIFLPIIAILGIYNNLNANLSQ